MAKIDNDQLIIVLDHAERSALKAIQEALILGIEKIGCSENSGDEDHKDAISWLSNMLRAVSEALATYDDLFFQALVGLLETSYLSGRTLNQGSSLFFHSVHKLYLFGY